MQKSGENDCRRYFNHQFKRVIFAPLKNGEHFFTETLVQVLNYKTKLWLHYGYFPKNYLPKNGSFQQFLAFLKLLPIFLQWVIVSFCGVILHVTALFNPTAPFRYGLISRLIFHRWPVFSSSYQPDSISSNSCAIVNMRSCTARRSTSVATTAVNSHYC